ncbi:MAG: S-methyl-5-thioribose-1-phosphate isomerase [Candidatus Alcyoniella australis]|nr:S-methyl-5-thioribose-1-phosphate isomerase [Candidatus Alcyoniella australis]
MSFFTVAWKHKRDGGPAVILLDQLKLPLDEVYRDFTSVEQVADAIRTMVVRGAPAIGITAAMGVALAACTTEADDGVQLLAKLDPAIELLAATRPTAVNLFWALERMRGRAQREAPQGVDAMRAALIEEAQMILDEDVAACRAMGRLGAELVPQGAGVLTHCNAGALATGGYGTALGVIRAAHEAGKAIHVFSDETRPYLQGSRLTVWELMQDKIPVTLLCDNTAGAMMARGKIGLVVVGADRIAANGDTANKIGTYSLAVLAAHHGIPFLVAAPTSTIDLSLQSGEQIPIERRSAEEVIKINGQYIAPPDADAAHLAFDVTPAALITAIVTERGLARPPNEETLAAIMG